MADRRGGRGAGDGNGDGLGSVVKMGHGGVVRSVGGEGKREEWRW
jgi:hypothetical protein